MRMLVSAGIVLNWLASAPAHAGITIEVVDPIIVAHIDKTAQRMKVSVDGKPVHSWKVSTGTLGYSTPVGDYAPYRMHTMWRSRQYDDAPMPHAVFFYEGYAVHGTYSTGQLGRRASHGCIRLKPANAKKFFNLILKHGRARTKITISGG
ncbi:MAG: L,D-transpeptidase [Rhizobiales bacterium]|nr:L,D-transpeptidase [Hyphomicrobiales bacterium]